MVDEGSGERCFKWGAGVTQESHLKQFKRMVGKGINCL